MYTDIEEESNNPGSLIRAIDVKVLLEKCLLKSVIKVVKYVLCGWGKMKKYFH